MKSLQFVQIDEFYPMDSTQENSFYYYVLGFRKTDSLLKGIFRPYQPAFCFQNLIPAVRQFNLNLQEFHFI